MDKIAEISFVLNEDGDAETRHKGDELHIVFGMAALTLSYCEASNQSLDKALIEIRNEARRIQIEQLADQIQETQGGVIEFEEIIKELNS